MGIIVACGLPSFPHSFRRDVMGTALLSWGASVTCGISFAPESRIFAGAGLDGHRRQYSVLPPFLLAGCEGRSFAKFVLLL